MTKEVREVKYVGFDSHRRPVFQGECNGNLSGYFYGCTKKLVPEEAALGHKEWVSRNIKSKDLEFFGVKFNCEPAGGRPALLTLKIVEEFSKKQLLSEEQSKDLQSFQESATRAAAESAHEKLRAVAIALGLIFERAMSTDYLEQIDKLKATNPSTNNYLELYNQAEAEIVELSKKLRNTQKRVDYVVEQNTELKKQVAEGVDNTKQLASVLQLNHSVAKAEDYIHAINDLKTSILKGNNNTTRLRSVAYTLGLDFDTAKVGDYESAINALRTRPLPPGQYGAYMLGALQSKEPGNEYVRLLERIAELYFKEHK